MIERNLPDNQYQAALNALSPTGSNPFATENTTNSLQSQINALTPSNVLISGAVVYSGTGFTYNVTALVYKIQNVSFTTLATSVTLSAADPTNPRIDVIYADNTGTIGVLIGVPSASPVKPTVDPLTQLELTFVTVPAGSTSPSVTTILAYDENVGTPTEWNANSDDANVDFNSLLSPYSGLKSINTLSPLGTNKEIIFTPAAPYTINGGTVNFRIKAKAPMNTASGILYIGFFNAGVLVGNSVYIGGSNLTIYGFDPNNTTTYQLVAIPISAFGVLPPTVGALRVFKLSGSSTANFYLDAVQIQEGVPTPTPPTPGHQIYDELVALTQRGKLSFVGAGVTATDDSVNDRTIITIPGGGGGSTWNNVVVVNNIATDLPAPVAGVRTLAANTTYWFNEGTHAFGTDRMVFQDGTNISGFGKTKTVLTYTGAVSFITGTNTNSIIRDLEIQGSASGVGITFSNTTAQSVYVEDVNFRSLSAAASITGGGFFARYNLILNCVSSGFTFSGTLGSVILDVCSFRPFTSGLAGVYAIKVNNGTTGTSFRCYNGIFDSAANHRGIWIDGTYTLSAGAILRGNIFGTVNPVADRLIGVNGNTAGWTIMFGENANISGLQFVDVEVISTADASLGNPGGTYIEGSTVRGYILPISSYDALATNMEGQITGLMTNAAGTAVQIGLRNLTTASNVAGSLGVATEGTLVPVTSVYVAITPNNNYHAYYVKANGSSTRYALKLRVKIY